MSDLKHLLHTFAPTRANGALLPAALVLLLLAGAVLQLVLPPVANLPLTAVAGRPPQFGLPAVDDPVVLLPHGAPALFVATRITGPETPVPGRTGSGAWIMPGPLGLTAVIGTMRVGGTSVVLLREAGGHVTRLARGETCHGWRLVAIASDAAKFRKGDDILALSYSATPPAPAARSDSESNRE